jgi:AcrR family transcriptional regulator
MEEWRRRHGASGARQAMTVNPQYALRGRPPRDRARQVADAILAAAEAQLERNYPENMSIRELARLASTNPSMIKYYFESKDGLIIELLTRYFRKLRSALDALGHMPDEEIVVDPTYRLIKAIVSHYATMPALSSIVATELRREDSRVRAFYTEHWPSTIKHFMIEFVERMVALGAYRPEVDPERIVEMMRGVIFFPLITRPYSSLVGSKPDFFVDEEWLRFVADVLDRYLCDGPAVTRPARTG